MHIDRLKRVPLRELWAHEARDFTAWLSENLDLLGETLGIPQLTLVQREAAAGVFSADILADDGQERLIVIENQLEGTNHDHLGKLITYLSNLDAKIAIWVTGAPPAGARARRALAERDSAGGHGLLFAPDRGVSHRRFGASAEIHRGGWSDARGASGRRAEEGAGRTPPVTHGVLEATAGARPRSRPSSTLVTRRAPTIGSVPAPAEAVSNTITRSAWKTPRSNST